MLVKLFFFIFGTLSFGMSIAIMFLSLIHAMNQDTAIALIALLSGFGGLVFSIQMIEKEVL